MTAATTTPSTLTTAPPPSPSFEEASEAYKKLVAKLRAITQLNRASSVLGYDRMVFMSHDPETAKERGAQISALASIIHEKSVDKEIKELILKAKDDLIHAQASHPSLYADEARLLELELKSFVENERVPAELAAKAAALGSTAYGAWMKAKADNDYASFQDVLGDCFETAKEVADAQRGDKDVSLYTQMLDQYEMGLPAERIDQVFGQVQEALVPLIAKVLASPYAPSTEPLSGTFPIDAQKTMCKRVLDAMGYNSERGRIDVSAHPFTSSSSPCDVRITSRFKETGWYQGLAASIHEGGHAIYEQALGRSALSIDQALSMGVHESQSLFWERHVGLSLPFWKWATGILKEHHPEVADAVTPEQVYEAINRVSPNLIRVESDELTYPLHVIMRYGIERDVVEGRLEVKDIPHRWNKEMKGLLQIDVPDDATGCLQDVHWSAMAIGYFPTYLLGSATAAQLAHFCKQDLPNFDELVSTGEFAPIKAWLTDKVHRHGRRYRSLDDLLEAQVGEKLNPAYFIEYLTSKYSAIYKLQ
jgi:carboxypeptidase Taq